MPEDTDKVTSVRIVCVDYYIAPPSANLDVGYSDFRGNIVKRVPVIRVFGSTDGGVKVCAHVHGVFPYLYIPMEEAPEDNAESSLVYTQFAYKITHALDRALSVSQGNVSTTTQHIFKAVPVRGRPFYGYHAQDHLFLKIYFYNPTMTKKAANLLQAGAICGRVYQAHESHVPYILQFFIDYNLYGMSFLHANSASVTFREESSGLPRMATTQMEIDLPASAILNRTRQTTGSEHQNPGIAAIWEDELRRRKELNQDELTPIEVPDSQERVNVIPTDTDRFQKEILRRKLTSEGDESLSEITVQGGKKFNLSVLLNNSVYPPTCPRTLRLPEASMVPDHITGDKCEISPTEERSFLEQSFIDEDLIQSLETRSQTQNDTLTEDDLKLLAIMEQLEECDDRHIDLDSTLAPLSQSSQKFSSSQGKRDNQQVQEEVGDSFEEFDEDLINEFNEAMDLVERIPQLDGEHEVQKQSPTRIRNGKNNNGSMESPKKSTRSPRKFPPLDIIITTPSGASKRKRSSDSSTPFVFKSILKTPTGSGPPNGHAASSGDPPPKKKLKFNNVVLVNGYLKQQLDFTPKRSSKEYETSKHFRARLERPPKNINYDHLMEKFGIKECGVHLTRIDISEYRDSTPVRRKRGRYLKNVGVKLTKKFRNIIIESPMVSVLRLEAEDITKISGDIAKKAEGKDTPRLSTDEAHKYDMEHNFFPIPGPSNVNYYKATDIPTQYYGGTNEKGEMCKDSSFAESEEGMTSFYDMTVCLDSTDDELSAFAREQEAILTDVMSSDDRCEESESNRIKIYPFPSPPRPETVRENMHEFGIEEHVYPEPFFSDPADVAQTSKKEIGQMVLHVKGNTLSSHDEFTSCLEDLQGLTKWRQNHFQSEMGDFVAETTKINVKEFMATEQKLTIQPQNQPPNHSDATTWLKVREKVSKKITKDSIEVDSPVKVKREKQKMNVPTLPDVEECNGKARCSLTFQSDPFSESQVIEASQSPLELVNMTNDQHTTLKSRLAYATRRKARLNMKNGSVDNISTTDKLVKRSTAPHRNNNVKRRTL
ncbi:hypothetical protein DMENIID0001_087150 [Sergentomyia squamirostris]